MQDMSEALVRLKSQNDELTGHQNPKQKIHLHQRIKEENNVLRLKVKVRAQPPLHFCTPRPTLRTHMLLV